MPRRNLQKASQGRVWTIEDRAGPSRNPVYQALARATGVSLALGDITPIRIPDPKVYGRYLTIDKIKGQPGLPQTTLEVRSTRDPSAFLTLTRKGCPVDLQVHVGACKDPSDFDLGWEKVHVFEDADFTNYSTNDLGAFDADQEVQVMETLDVTAQDYYEIKPLAFAAQAETQIVQEVLGVAICDSKTCGACGLPSDGCQRIFAIQTPVGASPGVVSELVFTVNGGSSWTEQGITSLPANRAIAPRGITCAGQYLLLISQTDCSYHYALIADILRGTQTWTKVTTGLTCVAGAPQAVFSLGRTQTYIVGDGGYIYIVTDPTAGATAQSSGDVTTQSLKAVHAYDEANVIAGGALNALVLTRNGGTTWTLVAGPSGQAAVTINSVFMKSENEWFLGYNDGKLFYTTDGGSTWTQKVIPGSFTVIDKVQFATQTVGYIIGHTATAGKILRTINGGATWYALPEAVGVNLPTNSTLNDIAPCGETPNVVWAGGVKTTAGDGILVKGA